MSQDETQVNADAEEQHEEAGDELDTNDTDTGADDSQDTGDDTADGDDAGNDAGFETQFKDQQKRATKLEGFLKAAGLDPKTGKPKVKSTTPKQEGNALSDADNSRITKAEERAERAEARSLGFTHSEDIEYLRKQAHKNFDGDVSAAADDEFVKSKLTRMKAVRETKDGTPPPNRRSGSSRSTKLPDFSKMSNEEFDKYERENRT